MGTIKCDFAKYIDTNLRVSHMYGHTSRNGRRTKIGPLSCQIQLSTVTLEAGVFLENARVGSCEIAIEVDSPQQDPSNFV